MTHRIATLAQDGTAETVFGLGFGVLVLILVVGALVVFIAALVSILQSRNYTTAGKAIWILVVLAFPFLGTIVWFVWGRGSSFTTDRQHRESSPNDRWRGSLG